MILAGGQVGGAHARAARIRTHVAASNSNVDVATDSESFISQETEASLADYGFPGYPEFSEG